MANRLEPRKRSHENNNREQRTRFRPRLQRRTLFPVFFSFSLRASDRRPYKGRSATRQNDRGGKMPTIVTTERENVQTRHDYVQLSVAFHRSLAAFVVVRNRVVRSCILSASADGARKFVRRRYLPIL